MNSLAQILLAAISIIWFFVFAHIIMSWLINFQVLNIRQPFVYQIWTALNRLLEPVYRRIRAFLPDLGGIDLAPLIVIFALYALQVVIANNVQ